MDSKDIAILALWVDVAILAVLCFDVYLSYQDKQSKKGV